MRTFGTHMINSVKIGEIINIDCDIRENENKSDLQIKGEVSAAYAGCFGKASAEKKDSARKFFSSVNARGNNLGGNFVGGISPESLISCVELWRDSINDNYALICSNETKVVPIWEFYQDYLNKLKDEMKFVTDLRVVIQDDSNVKVGTDEIVVRFNPDTEGAFNADMNRNAKGKYIYAIYKLDSDAGAKISDIQIALGEHPRVSEGYKLIRADLNCGAKGEYIYITYKCDASAREFQALGAFWASAAMGSRWKPITDRNGNIIDVNQGADGDYIYLATYSYDMDKAIDDEILIVSLT